MSRAIVTLIDGANYEELAKLALPLMRSYAQRCKADLVILDNKIGLPVPHYAKLQLRTLDYDQVLFLDIDILVNPIAPDIFDVYPDKIAMLDEGKFAERSMELAFFNGIFAPHKYYLDGWDKRYFNTGVMLIPRRFLKEFILCDKLMNHFGEQSYLNLMFCVKKLPIVDLDPKYNYQVSLFGRENRLGNFFIHYTLGKRDLFQFQMDSEALCKREGK
jgi:hypothetical protein